MASTEEEEFHLLTDNPPLSDLAKIESMTHDVYFAYILAIAICIFGIKANYTEHLGFLTSPWDLLRDDVLSFIVATIIFTGAQIALRDIRKLENKWETIYHTFSYTFTRKQIRHAIEVQIELPKREVTPDTLSHLKNCAVGPLFSLFTFFAKTPPRLQIWKYIEEAMAKKQREIGLHILRMEITGISEIPISSPNPSSTEDVDMGDII